MTRYGGVEVSECCFEFVNAEWWLMATESVRLRFGPEYFEAIDSTETDGDRESVATPGYQHLELLSLGAATVVRLLNHRFLHQEQVVGLAAEWNSVADRADCRVLFVDCSNVEVMSSELLSGLIVLQRRLKRKHSKLVLSGIRREVREIFRWTRLDHYFQINGDAEQKSNDEEALGVAAGT